MVYEPHIYNIDSVEDSSDSIDSVENSSNSIDNIDSVENTDNIKNNIFSIDSDIEQDSEQDNEDELINKKTHLYYNEKQEIQEEINSLIYHSNKNTSDWLLAKKIVSYSEKDSNFFWDYLDLLFKVNNDNFDNINKVIYSSNESVYEFNTIIAKFIVDNLKIYKFKPNGYIFNNNENNTWSFKIVVITTKHIYTANRYIDENKIGCY